MSNAIEIVWGEAEYYYCFTSTINSKYLRYRWLIAAHIRTY